MAETPINLNKARKARACAEAKARADEMLENARRRAAQIDEDARRREEVAAKQFRQIKRSMQDEQLDLKSRIAELKAERVTDERLDLARSNVSNSLRELLSYRLVAVTHLLGDRRDHYETSYDVWGLFRNVVRERKLREFDPTVDMLETCVADPDFPAEDDGVRNRIEETLALMSSLSAWGDEMLRLDPATLTKIMKLGSRIQKLIRDGRSK